MTSFTTVGDTLVLDVVDKGEAVTAAISGTYDMTIRLEREKGSKGSNVWEVIKSWSTANATVDFQYATQSFNERLRLHVTVDTSGTATVTLTDSDKELFRLVDDVGNTLAVYTQAGVTFPGTLSVDGAATLTGALASTANETKVGGTIGPAPVDVTTATLAVTAALHAGRVITLNRAAGVAVTMPDATGSGNVYTFIVGTTFTGAASIVAPDSSNTFTGTAILFSDAGDAVVAFATAATTDTVDLLGTANSTGGIAGAKIVFTDIAADKMHVEYVSDAGGTEATPFSATV